MSWFSKFKKKKMSSENTQDLKDQLSKYSIYQWIKTERAGMTTSFQDLEEQDGILFVKFSDGSRVNYALLDECLIRTNNDAEVLDLNVDRVTTPIKTSNATVSSIRATPVQQKQESPLQSLLKKQKPNLISIDISMEMNIPSQSLYEVICSSFDNAEDEIIQHIISGIDIEQIKESVRSSIKEYYKK